MSGRYYKLELIPPAPASPPSAAPTNGQPLTVSISKTVGLYGWESHTNGVANPSAQNINFDIGIAPHDIITGTTFVTVEGISLQDLGQVNNFKASFQGAIENSWGMRLYAGMLGGLPLSARQIQPGLLFSGTIISGIGKWVGTEMSLSFLVTAATPYSLIQPGGFVLNWQKGQNLAPAIQAMLQTVYPKYTIDMQIQENMVALSHIVHRTSALAQMAKFIRAATQELIGLPTYRGVSILFHGNTITVYDGTQPAETIALSFDSLIGQPTWVDAFTMQVTTILRSDIRPGMNIQLPQQIIDAPGFVTTNNTTANAFDINKYKLAFSGKFNVKIVRAIGDFRSEDGQYWITVIEAVPTV